MPVPNRPVTLSLVTVLAATLVTVGAVPGAVLAEEPPLLPLPAYDPTAVANSAQFVSAGGTAIGGTAGAATASDGGAARYTVPLSVVPGRGGFQPDLALSYSSDGGTGQLGTGFSLSGLSQISRCDKSVAIDGTAGAPTLTSSDAFCLNGMRLVNVAGVYGAEGTMYRTVPDTHVRVKSLNVTAGGPRRFTVWTPEGHVQEYGMEAVVTAEVPGNESLSTHNVTWPIVKATDTSNNAIVYKYGRDASVNTVREWWIESIRYGNGSTLDREVRFGYTTHPNGRTGYRHGDVRITRRLLNKVEMVTVVDGTAAQAREYRLAYEFSPHTGAAALTSLQECGRVDAECKRPTDFGWSYGAKGFAAGADQMAAPSTLDSAMIAADFSGDGRTDLAWPEADSWKYVFAEENASPVYRNLRNGIHTPADAKQTAYPLDYDLDGRVDLMPRSASISPYSPILSRANNTFVQAETDMYGGFNQITGGNQFAGGMTGDFDGDGYQDILQYRKPLGATGDDFPIEWTWRKRTGTVSPTIDDAEPTDNAAFADPVPIPSMKAHPPNRVMVVDLDGDGRDEVVFWTLSAQVVDVVANTAATSAHALPLGQVGVQGLTVVMADVNGDGLVDAVTNGDLSGKKDELYVLVNTGRRFNGPTRMNIALPSAALAFAGVVDHNRDGAQDLLVPRQVGNGDLVDGMDVVSSVVLNNVLTFTRTQSGIAFPQQPMGRLAQSRVVDADADGADDFVVVSRPEGAGPTMRLFKRKSGMPDLLSTVREGDQIPTGAPGSLPATVSFSYAPMSELSVYERGPCPRKPFLACAVGTTWLLRQLRVDAGQDGTAVVSSNYFYQRGKVDKRARTFRGFGERRVVTVAGSGVNEVRVTSRTWYTTESSLDPRPVEEWVIKSIGGGKHSLNRTVLAWQDMLSAAGTRFSYIKSTDVRDYEGDFGCTSCLAGMTPAAFDALGKPHHRRVGETREVDEYGNTTLSRTEATGNGSSTTEVRTTYDHDLANWLLRRPSRVVTTDIVAQTSTTRSLDLAYEPASTRVSSRKEYGDQASPGRVLLTAIGYDGEGNVNRTKSTDPQTGEVREATAARDPLGYPHAVMNALGHVSRTRHDPVSGQLVLTRDANGLRSDHTYDSLGRLAKTRRPTGVETVVRLSLEPAGAELRVRTETSDSSGALTQSVVDRRGRTTAERFKGFDGTLRERTSTYRPDGQLSTRSVFGPVGGPPTARTVLEYDPAGRPVRSTDPAGAVRAVEYAPMTTTEVDARGNRTRTTVDHRGLVVKAVDGVGSPAETARSYTHGPFGTLLSTEIDGVPASRSTFGYDERGQVVTSTDAERGTTTTTYNAFGEAVIRVDALGRRTAGTYDRLGRPLTSTVTQGGAARSTTVNRYDTESTASGERTRLGMLMSTSRTDAATPAGGAAAVTGTSYYYDDLGRTSQVRYQVPSQQDPSVPEYLTIGTQYDAWDRLWRMTYPHLVGQNEPTKVEYRYSSFATSNGRLQSINVVGGEQVWRATATDAQDRLVGEESGDGVKTTRQLDVLGRLSGQDLHTSAADAQPSRQLLDSIYTYDAEGNLTLRGKSSDVGSHLYEQFEYDQLDRVVTASMPEVDPCPSGVCELLPAERVDGDAPVTDNWAYDKLGNITGSKRRGEYAYDPAKPTQLKSITGGLFGGDVFRYDAVGNLTGRRAGDVTYTDMNLPATIGEPVKGGKWSSFLYYPSGERARKTTGGAITTAVPGLYERVDAGTRTEHRLLVPAQGRAVATLRFTQEGTGAVVPSPTLHIHTDHLGSTSVVTADHPEPGLKAVVAEERSHDAFGAVRSPDWRLKDAGYTTGIPHATMSVGFTGHDDDRELDLVNMTGRAYDPVTGRFLTPDPNVDGTNTTQAWNRYAYVSNNPVTNTDPTGFFTCTDCGSFDDPWTAGGGNLFQGGWNPTGNAELDRFLRQGDYYFEHGSEVAPGSADFHEDNLGDAAKRHDRHVREANEEVDRKEARRAQAEKAYQERTRELQRQLEDIRWKEKQAKLAGMGQEPELSNDQRLAQAAPAQTGTSTTEVADVQGCMYGPCADAYREVPDNTRYVECEISPTGGSCRSTDGPSPDPVPAASADKPKTPEDWQKQADAAARDLDNVTGTWFPVSAALIGSGIAGAALPVAAGGCTAITAGWCGLVVMGGMFAGGVGIGAAGANEYRKLEAQAHGAK